MQQNQALAIVNLQKAAAQGLSEAAVLLKQLNAGHNQIPNKNDVMNLLEENTKKANLYIKSYEKSILK